MANVSPMLAKLPRRRGVRARLAVLANVRDAASGRYQAIHCHGDPRDTML